MTEPEAAATHYSVERRLGDGELVAAYDLGGGTSDTTILRARAGGMEALGTPEGIERLDGMDFEEALPAHLDDRLGGAVSGLDPAAPEAATALAAIRAMCVRAKEDLFTKPDALLRVPLPDGGREPLVSRIESNEMIRPSVALTTEALERTISSARLKADHPAAVLLAGGPSRTPLVTQMVSEAFDRPVRFDPHPKFTVALGAATISRNPAVERSAAYGAELWMPELGGRYDPRNPSHKMLMSVPGGMSESERQHVQARARAAMDSQVLNEGRQGAQGGSGTAAAEAARGDRGRCRPRRAGRADQPGTSRPGGRTGRDGQPARHGRPGPSRGLRHDRLARGRRGHLG
ncbi:Hsp70 family protein [Actinokineospora sp. G85]|uniref:Hsp70 family protein n=1 Tax=Actinokineospora sp. G85 TaxID=3406626 RepID=UPI003C756A2B